MGRGAGNLWGCCVASQPRLMTFAGLGAVRCEWAVATGGNDLQVATELCWDRHRDRDACQASSWMVRPPLLIRNTYSAGLIWAFHLGGSAGILCPNYLSEVGRSHPLQGSLFCDLCLGLLAAPIHHGHARCCHCQLPASLPLDQST